MSDKDLINSNVESTVRKPPSIAGLMGHRGEISDLVEKIYDYLLDYSIENKDEEGNMKVDIENLRIKIEKSAKRKDVLPGDLMRLLFPNLVLDKIMKKKEYILREGSKEKLMGPRDFLGNFFTIHQVLPYMEDNPLNNILKGKAPVREYIDSIFQALTHKDSFKRNPVKTAENLDILMEFAEESGNPYLYQKIGPLISLLTVTGEDYAEQDNMRDAHNKVLGILVKMREHLIKDNIGHFDRVLSMNNKTKHLNEEQVERINELRQRASKQKSALQKQEEIVKKRTERL